MFFSFSFCISGFFDYGDDWELHVHHMFGIERTIVRQAFLFLLPLFFFVSFLFFRPQQSSTSVDHYQVFHRWLQELRVD
jgi:hypothetical protein